MTSWKPTRLLASGLSFLLLAGCDDRPTNSRQGLAEDAATQLESGDFVLDQLAPAEHTLRHLFANATRRRIAGGLTHYELAVRLGPEEFDVVRIHRVVRESRRSRPVRTDGAVFMVPGSGQTFDAIFLRPGVDDPDPQTSAPVYLAANGIDVWGIDLSWTQVPESTSDVSFMADWGVERDVAHTLAAMSIARRIRAMTGQGLGRLDLLGFSYGAAVAYAAAGLETQQPRGQRDIRGIIPVDFGLKTADDDHRRADCARADAIRARIAAGEFRSDVRGPHLLSQLARTAPEDPSPVIPGFTNYQAVLFIGTNPATFWHFVAVDFDSSGIPIGLLYTDPARWIRLLGASGSISVRATLDVATSRCDEQDVSIDDHLAEISVPILYVGAAGGVGTDGHHTTGLTASRDLTLHMVSLQPESQRALDYGHADLFVADDAGRLVWEPLRSWLAEHHGARPEATR